MSINKSNKVSSPKKLRFSYKENSILKNKKTNKYTLNFPINTNKILATNTNYFSCLDTGITSEEGCKQLNNKSFNFFTTQTDNQSQIENYEKNKSFEDINLNSLTNVKIHCTKDITKVPKIKNRNDSFEINGTTSRSLQSSKKIKKMNDQDILEDLKQEINNITDTDKQKIRSFLKNRTNFVRTCYMNKKSKNQLTTFSLKKAKDNYKNIKPKFMNETQNYFERSMRNNLLKSNFQKADYLKFIKNKKSETKIESIGRRQPYAESSSKIYDITEKNLKRAKTSYKKNLEMKSKIEMAMKQKYQSENNDLNKKIDDRIKNDAKKIHITQGIFIYGNQGGCFMKNRQAIHGMNNIKNFIKSKS